MVKITKKKVGEQEYYYLVHSFRKKGKVYKKQKYLGKEIPRNVSALIKQFQEEELKEVYKKLEKIKENFQREWGKIPESAKEREKQEIAIAFTYNTNAIEGSTITLEETREIVQDKLSPHKSLRDIKETEAHAKVFLAMLKEKEKLSEEQILGWHEKIFGETKPDIAGRYRDYLVRVGDYLAPDWQDVPQLMKEFVKSLSEKEMNSVEFSARAHYRFEKIHPFGDGNGRIGRLIMNNFLWFSGYPMLIIEYKKRKSYYKALKRDEEGFVKYFLRRYLAVHKKRISGIIET